MTIFVIYQISASIIALFIWWMEAFLDGRKEAFYASKIKMSEGTGDANVYRAILNEVLSEKRFFYLTPRLVMTYILVIGMKITVLLKYEEIPYQNWEIIMVLASLLAGPILSYSFIHDTTFYVTMNRRIPGHYSRGWKTNSDDSRFSVHFPTRLYLFAISIVLIAVQLLIHINNA